MEDLQGGNKMKCGNAQCLYRDKNSNNCMDIELVNLEECPKFEYIDVATDSVFDREEELKSDQQLVLELEKDSEKVGKIKDLTYCMESASCLIGISDVDYKTFYEQIKEIVLGGEYED